MIPLPRSLALLVLCSLSLALAGCAAERRPYSTSRDKTKKGAAIGAAAGAVLGALVGERELDEVLAGAAIGAGVGAGVGAYMDHQEERLARIPGTTVERVDDHTLLVHFDADVLFGVDSAVLGGEARSHLDQASQVFRDYPKTAILSQGHTDSTGSETHNQELSERRARSVANYLVGRGVDSSRITALGYGEGHAVATNDTPEGRSRNRRVDLLLRAKQ